MISAAIAGIEDKSCREFMADTYEKYHRLLFHVVRKWNDNALEQEDIVQECWLKLIQKAELLMTLSDVQLASYIAFTGRNTAFKHLEKKNRESGRLVHLDCEDIEVETDSPEEILISRENREQFQTAWEKLSDRDRLLLEGRYLFGQDNEELADWLGCKPDSVRMALTRARRTAMKEWTREV